TSLERSVFNYLLLLALVPLSMVPQLAFNIGPIPIHTLILSTAMLTVLIHYRNLFRIPRWFAYVCFGVAIFVSQLNAITVNLQSVLAEAGVWMIIPFVAVLFRHEKYRRFAVRIALL